MRIKKKYVLKEARILESMLLDNLGSLNPREKKVLKSLHKKYVDLNDPSFRYWRLSSYDITEELEEKWGLPLGLAHKLANIFVRHGDELFGEIKIKTDYHAAEILSLYFSKFIEAYIRGLDGDGRLPNSPWTLNVGGKTHNHRVVLWGSYKGFTLYLPVETDDNYFSLPFEEQLVRDESRVVVNVSFDFDDKSATLHLSFKVGETDEIEGIIIEKAMVDLPEEVNKQSMHEWIDDMINNQIKVIIEDFKFPDPPSVDKRLEPDPED